MEADKIIERSSYAIAADFLATLPRIGMALVFLGLTYLLVLLLNRVLAATLRRTRMRRALAELVVEIADSGVWVLAVFIAAAVAFPSVTPANILTGLGLGSVAIGFAFRDIFENFLAGVLILYREPFRLGDCIECEDVEGFVEEITARDTHLRQTDGQRVILPNAMLLKNQVWVWTDRPIRRTTVHCRVALEADVDAARATIKDAVVRLPTVAEGKEVQIFAHAFPEEGGVEFEVTWWTGSKPVEIRRSRDEVVAAVKRALDEAGIALAVPARRVAVETRPEDDGGRTADAPDRGPEQGRRRAEPVLAGRPTPGE